MAFPEESEFVCVYGWDKVLYEEALRWVNEKRRVAFVSEEERTSADPRVQIYHLESPLQLELIAKQIGWAAVLKKLTVLGSPSFQEEVEKVHLAAHLILSEAADCWVGVLKNARANRKPHRNGLDLKGAFQGIPALIVGAGPSLEKNGHLLRLFENKALIFAGGSALNVIDHEPHFAASIDPQAPYQQFKRQPFSETPFCYQSRMSAENFSLVHGERILFPDSSSEAINWINNQEPFDSGWTVGNFLTAVASHFGCDPIILVGMDLCYVQNRKYAQIEAAAAEGLISFGDVLTQRDWLMAARWTEARKERLINATEGGILSLPAEKLSAVLAKCTQEWDLRKKVQDAIQKISLVDEDRWTEWDASFRRCQENGANLEEEIVYQKLLLPLWQIWRPVFESAEPDLGAPSSECKAALHLHQTLFFQRILEEHAEFIL